MVLRGGCWLERLVRRGEEVYWECGYGWDDVVDGVGEGEGWGCGCEVERG